MFDGKTIFILGAGASMGHSKGNYPSIYNFFSKAKELNIISDSIRKIKPEYQDLYEYIKGYFGLNILREKTKIDIEYVLTTIEIELERLTKGELTNIRKQIINIIVSLLSKINIESEGEYNIFLNYLKGYDTLITFNWDILLDDLIGRKSFLNGTGNTGSPYSSFLRDYSVYSDFRGHVGYKKPFYKWEKNSRYYLKLHGSIDWIYCDNDHCRVGKKVDIAIEPMQKYYCHYCHEEMKLLLIPPILYKQYRSYPLIRQLWSIAAQEMQVADNIVIWGYSLPSTDFYTKWLLLQARLSKIQKLVLINPSVARKYKDRETYNKGFIKKFYDLYRDKLPKSSIYLFKNFTDFNNKIDLFKKIGKSKRRIFEKKL